MTEREVNLCSAIAEALLEKEMPDTPEGNAEAQKLMSLLDRVSAGTTNLLVKEFLAELSLNIGDDRDWK